MKPDYQSTVEQLRLIERLSEFNPTIIGTPPLEIDVESSDIDIACHAPDLDVFERRLYDEFDTQQNFCCRRITTRGQTAICARLHARQWCIEYFGQAIPIESQWGVRHFHIEKRVLDLAPQLREQVIRLKESGIKTEPAFAQLLGLKGDPYEAVLSLERYTDRALLDCLA